MATVILTRPEGRADNLKKQLAGCSHNIIELPCLEIANVSKSDDLKQLNQDYKLLDIYRLLKFDCIIFVSVNAVISFFNVLEDRKYFANNYHGVILAIGSKTACSLKEHKFKNIKYPTSEYDQNSEAFVSLPELQEVKNKNVLIVRGDTGREYISTYLQNNGAKLSEIVVYKTQYPNDLDSNIKSKLGDLISVEGMALDINDKDMNKLSYPSAKYRGADNIIILITSKKILENFHSALVNNLNKDILNAILKSNLVIVSERIAQAARTMGFSNIFVSNTMNEDSIADIINRISKNSET